MLYEYQCSNGNTVEVIQSIHDEALTQCECGGKLERIVTGGLGVIFETKTIGSFVEQKRSSMGHYQREELDRPAKEKEQKLKESAPWWRPNTTQVDRKLLNMTPEQSQNYIENG